MPWFPRVNMVTDALNAAIQPNTGKGFPYIKAMRISYQYVVFERDDLLPTRAIESLLFWVHVHLNNDRLILVIVNLPVDRFLLLHDDVNVAGYQLGDGLSLGRLDGVERLRVVTKVLRGRGRGRREELEAGCRE